LGFGPEDVPEQTPESEEIRFSGSSWIAHFLVIAAPRPSGLADLESIQASVTGGRFFVENAGKVGFPEPQDDVGDVGGGFKPSICFWVPWAIQVVPARTRTRSFTRDLN
jgi:hypothetical protein